MKIVDIFSKKEYLMFFNFFLFHFIAFLLLSDYMPDILPLKLYRISFAFFLLYNEYCIFLESSFDNKLLKLLQNKLQKINLFFASFIGLLSVFFSFMFFIKSLDFYLKYKINCPFLLKNFDYNIHAQRRCELYNINSTNIFPYQYICSFNPDNGEINCSKVEKLIKNNEIIDEFIKEYNKEKDLYYCDLKAQPYFFKEINPKLCDEERIINPLIFIILDICLGVTCIIFINTYFRTI